ncbi:MAG: T9SS type A sorting domain-containing protein [Chitinophagaceae bacterium]|nr:T9SS type A sorting domain-containing protein [Chitinophagaceae bacterium]
MPVPARRYTSSLSLDVTVNQAGACGSSATDYYRSIASGNWNDLTTWESSPDNVFWYTPATLAPTFNANAITIRNGHTVNVTAPVTVDQVVIENGGNLNQSAAVITVNDGTGVDIDIQNGGAFTLSLATNPPLFGSGNPNVNVATGGILRVSASGLTAAAPANGVNVANYVYQHQSILEFTLTGGFTTGTNIVYFPNVDAVTIPIFRTTANSPTIINVGAGTPTTFNGIFEVGGTGTVRWQNGGDKIFRNGIRGQGNMDYEVASIASAKFIINGNTAELGGTGSLLTPPSGLQIGSASGTTVTVSDNKVVTGDISLISTNTFVDLGTSNLTVTGNVSGGTATSYIRTASTGSLILNTVDATGKTFPVGHSSYNPVKIANGSNHNWTVNVNDGVTADLPQTTAGAVLLTWNITPSVNPPAAGADITFQFDAITQTGGSFNVSPYDIEPIQPWHRKLGYWLASGTTVPLVNIGGNLRTVTGTGLTQFSPYALSRISLPLPIKLVNFNAIKLNASRSLITWDLAACCSRDARFDVQRSADGINFSTITTIAGSETNRFYTYHDNTLQKGINYYRLKGIDVDGKISYSKVVAIINDASGLLLTTIAPNPVQDNMTVSLSAAKAATVRFVISDIAGRPVKQWSAPIAEGSNTISINAAGLAAGIYHLGAMTGDSKTVIRFVKQ